MPPSVPPPSTNNKNTLVCSTEVVTTSSRDSPMNSKTTNISSSSSSATTGAANKHSPVLTPTLKNRIETTNVLSERTGDDGPFGGNNSNSSSSRKTDIVRQTMVDGYAAAKDHIIPRSSGGVTRESSPGISENQPAVRNNPVLSASGGMDPLSINPYYGSSNITGYGGGGMMYSPYSSYGYGMNSNYPYYGGHNYNTLTSPFNMTGFGHPGITNLLFNFQSIVFSLGQTIQIVSMNSHALQQMMQSTKTMLEQVMHNLMDGKKYFERILQQWTLSLKHEDEEDPDNTKQLCRRRRLQALRWTLVFTISCIGYKLVQYLIRYRRQRQRLSPEDLVLFARKDIQYDRPTIMANNRYASSMDYDHHHGMPTNGPSSALTDPYPNVATDHGIAWNHHSVPSQGSYGHPNYYPTGPSSYGYTAPSSYEGNPYYNNRHFPGSINC